MRLEKKRDEEVAARKGMTGRTIVAFIWFAFSAVLAYFLVNYLLDQNIIRFNMFYSLGIPRSVPTWVFLAVLILAVVVIMQIFLLFGFMMASPEGRRRTGDPTLYSRTKDPLDDHGGRG